jgi:hypothetical protein
VAAVVLATSPPQHRVFGAWSFQASQDLPPAIDAETHEVFGGASGKLAQLPQLEENSPIFRPVSRRKSLIANAASLNLAM